MLVSELITNVAKQVVDINHVRWTREELLDFLNMGLSALILKRPDISRTTTIQESTESKITFPDDAYSIININHVNNRATQYVDINKLSQVSPTWRTDVGDVRSWTRNEFDNDCIYLYPHPGVPVNVEMVYAKNIKIINESEEFPIKDIYKSIIFDYMIYRAFAKDSEQPGEAEKAKYHLMLFKDSIGDKDAADALREQVLQNKERQR